MWWYPKMPLSMKRVLDVSEEEQKHSWGKKIMEWKSTKCLRQTRGWGMAHWLRALAAPVQDSVLNSQHLHGVAQHHTCNSISRGHQMPPSGLCSHLHSSAHTHINTNEEFHVRQTVSIPPTWTWLLHRSKIHPLLWLVHSFTAVPRVQCHSQSCQLQQAAY